MVRRLVMTLGLVVGMCPGVAWAACEGSPLFTIAPGKQLLVGSGLSSWVVAARDKESGCRPDALTMSVAGLPPRAQALTSSAAPGEVAATVLVWAELGNRGHYDVTFTVTDLMSNTSSVTLPIDIGDVRNSTPTLDPVSDLFLRSGGSPVTFTVGLSDLDGDLFLSTNTLQIQGLPANTRKVTSRYTGDRIAQDITIFPSLTNTGIYRVNIMGKDGRGASVIAQMRIVISP